MFLLARHIWRRASCTRTRPFEWVAARWGLQFHLEVDRSAARAFVGAFGDEAKAAGVAPGAISAQAGAVLAELATRQQLVLERFAFLVS